jgi:serine phosphatase RsbU (regulator of sigma subunit)
VKDTIFNEESNKQMTEMETKYETEKKDKEIQLLNKDKTIQSTELEKQKMVRNSFIGGFLLVLALAFFILRGYNQKQKANQLLEEKNTTIENQKQIVEEHQKEIIDSITYAKRIQEAILPPEKYVKDHLPESFILYQPKDIVAGDFYWMEIMNDIVFIAVADCTGHGVPGAMVSVVCSTALNRAVKEFGILETGKILDKVTELVIETFERSDSDVKDGMDISLIAINKKTKQVQWSGANNPLWYIDNGILIEVKADKQPIGKFENNKPFNSHLISYNEGNVFYLFTDGYADQFGGPKGKKFKYAQLKELIIANHLKAISEQQRILSETLTSWKGNMSQVDDICIIGIKVS